MKINEEKLEVFYIENYKKLMLIPIILAIISLILIGSRVITTGDPFNKDVSLKGGISVTIPTDKEVAIEDIQKAIPVDSTIRKLGDPTTGKQVGIMVDVSDITLEKLKPILEKVIGIKIKEEDLSVENTNPSLGATFYKDLMKAILIAFVLMAIVIFIAFRNPAPSLAIIQAPVTETLITLAIVNLLGVKISGAGIVAFLLMIGYSVDTDILLTTRVLKSHQGTIFSRMLGAMKTGLTMSAATLGVLTVGLLLTTSPVFKEMFLILFISILIDIPTTYLTNGGILFWYVTRKK